MRFLPYPSTMIWFLCISVFGGCSCICVLANLPCFASTLKLISIRWYGSLSCGSLDISYQHSNFCLKTSGFLDNLNFHKFNSKVIEFSTSILFSVLYILLINSIKLKWVELQSIQLDWYVKLILQQIEENDIRICQRATNLSYARIHLANWGVLSSALSSLSSRSQGQSEFKDDRLQRIC